MEKIELAKKAQGRLKFVFPYSIEDWVNNGMVMENYHKHTYWSNIVQPDSTTSMDSFIEKCKERNCQCYFSGEHGYQGEWLKAYDVCKSSDIKFRYSVEVYWVKYNEPELKDNTNCHMVIVARTYEAIKKLNYIISKAHEFGYYYKPRISLEDLFTLTSDDVYVTSACIAGWKYEDATEIWYRVFQHFGDSFFLEYQCNNTDKQKEVNRIISAMSKEFGIQTIIGLDTHYIDDKDKIKRDNLLARKKIEYPEEEGWYMDFPSGEEVFVRMKEQGVVDDEDIIYSMMNTNVFINGCEELKYDTNFKIPILDRYKGMTYDQRCSELKKILNENYSKEDSNHKSKERVEGLIYEMGEIEGSGTVDYFLDNYELVKLAKEKYNGILTTTSRGSASSYYSSKLLGFTTLDRFESEVPIYPERFITKDRILASHQMPDIDMNVQSQEPFVAAARELFGEYGCYPLLAVGTFGEKSGFKLYADINNIEPSVANDITSCIDAYNEDLKNVEDDEKDSIDIADYIKDKHYLEVFNQSKDYQGIIEQAKCHACGHLLLDKDIRYEIGLIRQVSKNGNMKMVVNAEGSLLDSYGYVKDDFLIVDVVGIIYKLYGAIGREVPSVSELREMVKDDDLTWKMYEMGATCCLNQCEKPGTTHKVKHFKPKNPKELAAFVAGIRPGFKSLINGFLDRVSYSNGESAIDELLEDCFHYMLYQEAVMKIFTYLGIPMKDSYDTIKKISKKKLKGEALKHVEDTLRDHWLENIGNLDNFDRVYKVIKDSARYSFNAPHALSMCFDSLYEAWMKGHNTSEFYEVVLNHYQDKKDKDKVNDLIKEATTLFGYKFKTYKWGDDNRKFVVDDDTKIIHPNLASVKNMNEQVVEELYELSHNNYTNFVTVLEDIEGKTSLNSRQLDILIKLNYFSDFGDINAILKMVEIFRKVHGKKSLKKCNLENYGLSEDMVKKYTIKETEAIYKYDEEHVSMLLAEVWESLQGCQKCTLRDIIKYQVEYLGYIDYKDENLDSTYIVVTKLDTKYSPKFTAYCLKNGQTCEMRVSKTKSLKNKALSSFADKPFEEGDILKMIKCNKKPKQRKTDTGWETVVGEFNWWLTDYNKTNM